MAGITVIAFSSYGDSERVKRRYALPMKSCRKSDSGLTLSQFSKLLSSLPSLRNVNSTENLLVAIQSIMYNLEDCDIHFTYVQGNRGNFSNGRVDQLAKEATCQDMKLLMSVPLYHWKHLAWERAVSAWSSGFLALPKALWTKKFFPTIYQRLKCRKCVAITDSNRTWKF
ncbi:hypothetical protein TNCV_2086881 [Trichonephila clavipes]|nr:hypothetical protein TNCV_2086881 [Trichonephila clavipes]